MYYLSSFTKLSYHGYKKKLPEELRWNKHLNQACREVPGFTDLLAVFERNMSVLGRSASTFENYARHIASLALHYGCLPTELDPEQVKDYLYGLQQRSTAGPACTPPGV